MTALPIIETQMGDLAAYVPTNVISITDGQIYLEEELFHSGMRPGHQRRPLGVARGRRCPGQRHEEGRRPRLRLELAQYRELAAFAQFGTEIDQATQMALERGSRCAKSSNRGHTSPWRWRTRWPSSMRSRTAIWTTFPWPRSARSRPGSSPILQERRQGLRQRHRHPARALGGSGAALRETVTEFKTARASCEPWRQESRGLHANPTRDQEPYRQRAQHRPGDASDGDGVCNQASPTAGARGEHARLCRQVVGSAEPPGLSGRGYGARQPALLRGSPVKRIGMLLITSDRGMVGAYHDNVIALADAHPSSTRLAGGNSSPSARWGARPCCAQGMPSMPISTGRQGRYHRPDLGGARAARRLRWPRARRVSFDEVVIAYTQFCTGARLKPTIRQLLPVCPSRDPGTREYLYEPSRQELLSALLPRLIRFQVYQAFLESLAAENASRMVAMHSATQNAAT